MTSIPNHIRHNYEHTDDLLNHLRAHLVALDHLADAAIPTTSDPTADALLVVIHSAQEKLREIERARMKEWVGLGGSTETLTDEEAAQARAEK